MFSILLFISGCNDEDTLTHVTDFEKKIQTAVNTYRATKTLSAITLQFLMVDDAQGNSRKMADGTAPYSANPTDEVMVNLTTLKNNLGGDDCAAVVQFSESENADTIVNRIKRDPLKREVIEGDFNQIGVGSAKQSATGKWYVTILLIHIP
jgi:uncharacterized protein YkwD